MAHSSPEGIILGKGATLVSLSLKIEDKEVLTINNKKEMTKRLTNGELAKKIQEQEQLIKDFETNLDLLKGSLKESQERITALINENVYVKGKVEALESEKQDLEESWKDLSTTNFEQAKELSALKGKWYVKLFS